LIDAVVGLCVRYGSQPRPLVRRISDASFLVYIVHLPIVVLLQIAIARR
jgi:peptidoglycan/LPS O-acetylase OafA/YrhL